MPFHHINLYIPIECETRDQNTRYFPTDESSTMEALWMMYIKNPVPLSTKKNQGYPAGSILD
jgi:hypothetical protein